MWPLPLSLLHWNHDVSRSPKYSHLRDLFAIISQRGGVRKDRGVRHESDGARLLCYRNIFVVFRSAKDRDLLVDN